MKNNCQVCGGLLVETATRGSAGWYTIHQCAMCGRSPENLRRVDENPDIARIRHRAKAATNGDPLRPYAEDVEITTVKSTHQKDIVDASAGPGSPSDTVLAPAPLSRPLGEGLLVQKEDIKEPTGSVPAPECEKIPNHALPEEGSFPLREETSTKKEAPTVDSQAKKERENLRKWRMEEAGLTSLELSSRLINPKTQKAPHPSIISAWELGKQPIPQWAKDQILALGPGLLSQKVSEQPHRRTQESLLKEYEQDSETQRLSPRVVKNDASENGYYCEIPLPTIEAFADLARMLSPLGWSKLTICRR